MVFGRDRRLRTEGCGEKRRRMVTKYNSCQNDVLFFCVSLPPSSAAFYPDL
jgi:hypothetical protein